MSTIRTTLAGALTAALALSLAFAGPADARRGGSFGSRGYRTYSAPRPTSSTPGYAPPVQRSMTPQQPGGFRPTGPSYQPGYQPYGGFNRPRMGFGGGLVAGLLTGGLIGGLMGHGWGMGWGGYGAGFGMGGGFLTILIQLLVVGVIISLVMRMFRRRQAYAGGGWDEPAAPFAAPFNAGPQPGASPWGAAAAQPPNGGPWSASDEIAVTGSDRAAFERMLTNVQDAFAREDYGRLRELCTPEVMGYLAEELSDNATHGRKNDVSQVKLLRTDVSEAWNEADADYATVALTYESIDIMRDRQTGAVLSGDPNRPTQTTELWTFVRRAGGPWKLSAIQET